MRFRAIMRLGLILPVFLFGCVSTSKFNAVSNDYHVAQQEISDRQKKIDELKYVLRNAEEDTEHCRRNQAQLQGKIKMSNTEKKSVSKQTEELNYTVNKQATTIKKQAATIKKQATTIKKHATVISIQEAVIRMLDDPQQTIQTSIKEQIAAQNLETSASPSPRK